ncbi:MAG TPA: hypothetical protein VGI40_27725 [Pirellulaceae bacterium]|jgi:hypothetical protein
MSKHFPVRVVTRSAHGALRVRYYATAESLRTAHTQIGVDDCSSVLSLRGLPVFRELVGPIPEGENVAQYETPEVFEMLTLEWSKSQSGPRCERPQEAIGPLQLLA